MKYFYFAALLSALLSCANNKSSLNKEHTLGKDRAKDYKVLTDIIRQHDETLSYCLQDELSGQFSDEEKEKYDGKITLEMSISPTGEAQRVRIRSSNKLHSANFKECLRKVVAEIEFPQTSGKIQDVVVKFDFSVNESYRLIWR